MLAGPHRTEPGRRRMGHFWEEGHGNLPMSATIDGTCQMAERSLGLGGVLGLGEKYR